VNRINNRATLAAVLLGCFMCQAGLGCGYIFGALLKHIVAEFEWSRAAFSLSAAPLLLAMGGGQVLVGQMVERAGARAVLSSAVLLLGGSLMLFSTVQNLWQFYLYTAMFGLALAGCGDVAVGAVTSRWVSSNRGLALAFVYVGSNVGGALVPILADQLAAAYSWREAVWWIGIGATAIILPFALFAVRDRPLDSPDTHTDIDPAGGEATAGSTTRADATGGVDLPEALRTPAFWIFAWALFSFYFYYLAVNQHLVAYLGDIGYDDARAAAGLGLAVALGVGSKLAVGLLADRLPARSVLLANFALITLASLLLLGAASPAMLLAFLLTHGVATAAENVVVPMALIDCFGQQHLARIYGALMFTLFPAGVLGSWLAGSIFDLAGSYTLAFALFATLNGFALATLTRLRPARML
jgi:sugar phosphate permease